MLLFSPRRRRGRDGCSYRRKASSGCLQLRRYRCGHHDRAADLPLLLRCQPCRCRRRMAERGQCSQDPRSTRVDFKSPAARTKVTLIWQEFEGGGLALLQRYEPQLAAAGRWLLNLSAGLMVAVLEIFAGIIVAAMIHASRIRVVGFVSAIVERIVGPRGLVLLNAGGKSHQGRCDRRDRNSSA